MSTQDVFSLELLRSATQCSVQRAKQYHSPLNYACKLFDITTPKRLAAFFAQLGHESGSLYYAEEIASGENYEGRRDLGNIYPGDGKKFKGRGPIQLTGRRNYVKLRMRLRDLLHDIDVPDFEEYPHLVAEPFWGSMAAGLYWHDNKLNALADAGDFIGISRAINLGNAKSTRVPNGNADRERRHAAAIAALAAASYNAKAGEAEEASEASAMTRTGGDSVAFPNGEQAPEGEAPEVSPAPSPVSPMMPPGEAPDWVPPQPESNMPLPLLGSFAVGLASSLFQAFTPLAKEKLTKEMARHTDPAIAEQIASNALEVVKTVTGKVDPVEAVTVAKQSAAVMAQVESSVLDELEKLAPLLERMHKMDMDAVAVNDASMDAASRRAAGQQNDQDPYLTRAIIYILVGVWFSSLGLLAGMIYMKASESLIATVLGLMQAIAMIAVTKFGTRYDHRYGSSAGSANKDAVRDAALANIVRK